MGAAKIYEIPRGESSDWALEAKFNSEISKSDRLSNSKGHHPNEKAVYMGIDTPRDTDVHRVR